MHLYMPATDAGEMLGIQNLRPRFTSSEDTINIYWNIYFLVLFVLIMLYVIKIDNEKKN
jgi:hypothetical protein